MYTQQLDPTTNNYVLIKLYRNVKNITELRQKIITGELKCSIVKPSLILDPFQIVVAANKAAIAEKLTTKTIHAELLFNLSVSKNISQSLQKFGIDDKEKDILVVIICKNEDKNQNMEVFNKVEGEEVEIELLSQLSDLEAIKNSYKINDLEAKNADLIDSVVSRIAAKDIMSV